MLVFYSAPLACPGCNLSTIIQIGVDTHARCMLSAPATLTATAPQILSESLVRTTTEALLSSFSEFLRVQHAL